MDISLGSTVWRFDRNHRVYARDASGTATGPAIFREYFRPTTISGQTTKSWVTTGGLKIPKAGGDVRECAGGAYGKIAVYMTQEAVDAECWRQVHRWRLAKKVEECNDVALLKQIAALVGYRETP